MSGPLNFAGVVGPTGATGATGAAGTHLASMLVADATNATGTMAASGLSVPVTSGRRYIFRAVLLFSDPAGEGLAIDFDTSAAAANFRAHAVLSDSNGAVVFDVITTSSITADVAANGGAGSVIEVAVDGSYEPSATGNFLIRFAQQAHVAGTLTLNRGSSLILWEVT